MLRRAAGAGEDETPARADPEPVDVRPAINGYEKDAERIIADCRSVLDRWP
jgi:hypothetical protein